MILASVVVLAMRLWRVGKVPAGFHTDEMMMLANSVCLRHTGVDLWGHGWSFFSGGPINPYGYFIGAPFHLSVTYSFWLYLVGDTIVAARSFEVLISLAIVGCTTGIAYNMLGRRAAVWTLALSAISPWTWTLSRMAFVHTEFITMHLFIGLLILTRHFRHDRPPSASEVFWGGLFLGVSLSQFYSTLATAFVALLAALYIFKRTSSRLRPAVFAAGILTSYIPCQIGFNRYVGSRINQMASFEELKAKSNIIDKVVTLVRITFEHLWQHLSLDFLVFRGDPNLRHHSGWGGELSWPQILLVALLPLGTFLLYRNFQTNRRYLVVLALAGAGALGGLLTSSLTGEQVSANRSLVAAPFIVLGCTVVALVVTPAWKQLTAVCLVLGAAFGLSFLHDYFNDYPERSREWFQDGIRVAGEEAQRTGDFTDFNQLRPKFVERYGLLSEVGLVFYEAAGTGRGCPGYDR